MEQLNLSTQSIRSYPYGEQVLRILEATFKVVDPYQAVRDRLRMEGSLLRVGNEKIDLARYKRVLVVGTGKAGAPMLQAAAYVLGRRLNQAIVVTKEGHAAGVELGDRFKLVEAGHPVPDERGVQAGKEIAALLESAGEDDLVLCLVSGGGSALMTTPAEGITLAELQELTGMLLHCGATINQINTLRKHLEQLKGGGVARLAAPARVVTLVLSDVVGDPLDVIASGPTVPDPTTFQDAMQILEDFSLVNQVPTSIHSRLERGIAGEIAETPKPGDPLFKRVSNQVIASNMQAARAALTQAEAEGFHPLLLTTFLQGEAGQVGKVLAAIAREVEASNEPINRPACIVAGGETTVTVQGNGMGGRNQELALGAVRTLAGMPGALLVALATDGGDGPTEAAGAVASGETLERASALGMIPEDFLRRNDAYTFFKSLDDLLLTGPTRTNVNDLAFLFVG